MFDFEDILNGLQGIDDDSSDAMPNELDTNGDGIIDAAYFDTNGDGVADAAYFDTNGDGMQDTMQTNYGLDMDGDGFIDTIATETDYGMDGMVDFTQYQTDTDGDGIVDMYSEAFMVDTNDDGIADSLEMLQDRDMDGVFDVDMIVNDNGEVTMLSELSAFQDETAEQFFNSDDFNNGSQLPPSENDMYYYNDMAIRNASHVQQFDPDDYDDDDIIGEPEAAMDAYHVQETNSSCAVAAQEFVLDQLTGHDFSEAELRNMAEQCGWYSPGEGTMPYDIGNVLAECGLKISRNTGNDLDDIAGCLERGGGVVVGVDIYELYDIDVPGEGANHAIQVIGIDRSDPDSPMVIINDSGMENGAGKMIPYDDFMDAWEDSDFLMVEAYND